MFLRRYVEPETDSSDDVAMDNVVWSSQRVSNTKTEPANDDNQARPDALSRTLPFRTACIHAGSLVSPLRRSRELPARGLRRPRGLPSRVTSSVTVRSEALLDQCSACTTFSAGRPAQCSLIGAMRLKSIVTRPMQEIVDASRCEPRLEVRPPS